MSLMEALGMFLKGMVWLATRKSQLGGQMANGPVCRLMARWKSAWIILPLYLKITFVITVVVSCLFESVVCWWQWFGLIWVIVSFLLLMFTAGPNLLLSLAGMSDDEGTEHESFIVIKIMVPTSTETEEPGLHRREGDLSEQ